jgi:hypothetical protein
MIRKQIVEELVTELENSALFKKVYKNIVPVWTKVTNVPAAAVIYATEEAARHNNTSSKMRYYGNVYIYIYNKQSSNKYEDNLTELIDEVQRIVLNNEYLRCNTIETIMAELKRDGGTIHPWSMAQLKIEVSYLQYN